MVTVATGKMISGVAAFGHPVFQHEVAFEDLGVVPLVEAGDVETLRAAVFQQLAAHHNVVEKGPVVVMEAGALALFHQQNGQMDEAETLYRQILDINEQSADAWHNLGYIELTYYNDYQRAVEYFDKALEADPSHQAANANRQLAMEMVRK